MSLDDLARRAMADAEIPGLAAAAVARERCVFARGWGFANVDRRTPATETTPFLLASPSKLVVAAVVLALSERRMLDLDADVNAWLPFALLRPVTLRLVLQHRASIVDDIDAMRASYALGDSPVPLADWVRDHCAFSSDPPDTREQYANMGFAVAALAAETAAKMRFYDLARALVLGPLGMTGSGYRLCDVVEPATPYERVALDHYGYPDYPVGALRTSAVDFARFLRCMLIGAPVLSRESVDRMLAERLGWRTVRLGDRELVGHDGADRGAGSRVLAEPTQGTAIVLLGNAQWTYPPERERLLDPLAEALFEMAGQAGGGDL